MNHKKAQNVPDGKCLHQLIFSRETNRKKIKLSLAFLIVSNDSIHFQLRLMLHEIIKETKHSRRWGKIDVGV